MWYTDTASGRQIQYMVTISIHPYWALHCMYIVYTKPLAPSFTFSNNQYTYSNAVRRNEWRIVCGDWSWNETCSISVYLLTGQRFNLIFQMYVDFNAPHYNAYTVHAISKHATFFSRHIIVFRLSLSFFSLCPIECLCTVYTSGLCNVCVSVLYIFTVQCSTYVYVCQPYCSQYIANVNNCWIEYMYIRIKYILCM